LADNANSEVNRLLQDSEYRSMNKEALACLDIYRRVWSMFLHDLNEWPSMVLEDVFWGLYGKKTIQCMLTKLV
jgi:flagellar biosynthesis regulator FlaF